MIVLDTDHLTVLRYPENAKCIELATRLEQVPTEDFAITIISVEEQIRGLLALLHRTRDVKKQVPLYARFTQLFDFFSRWRVLPFNSHAAEEFNRLRQRRIRIGTMDLKIASIALVHQARVLSGNLRDFRQVPGLQVASWLAS